MAMLKGPHSHAFPTLAEDRESPAKLLADVRAMPARQHY